MDRISEGGFSNVLRGSFGVAGNLAGLPEMGVSEAKAATLPYPYSTQTNDYSTAYSPAQPVSSGQVLGTGTTGDTGTVAFQN